MFSEIDFLGSINGSEAEGIHNFINERNGIYKISYGQFYMIAVCNDGSVFQIRKYETCNSYCLVKLDFFDDKKVRKIFCCDQITIVVCNEGVYFWNKFDEVQQNNEDSTNICCPTRLDFFDGKQVRKIAFNYKQTIVVCDDGVYLYVNRLLRKGIKNNPLSPHRIVFFDRKYVRKIACGFISTIIVCDDGVYSWGGYSSWILGRSYDLNTVNFNSPIKIDFFDDKYVYKICCGHYHAMAICRDGSVYSWGNNKYGQLGINNKNEKEFFLLN